MNWHQKVLSTFPSISRSDIGVELEEKCKSFGHKCAPSFVLGDISKNALDGNHIVRDHKTAYAHSCYGKILEIAYCKIIDLNLSQVVFEDEGPDTHDVKYGQSLIDVTSSKILVLHLKDDPFSFEFTLAISKAKYNSVLLRTSGYLYKADSIAFLQQKLGDIFYFGQSKINNIVSKEVEEKMIDDKPCILFNFKGRKERTKNGLILLY
jgi:hypothetical protein